MADIAIFRINYKSDFILTLNSDAGWMTPFCIKFWTGAPSQAYFVGYDGATYTHCAPVDGEPTKLRVQFDDHHLPIGDLKFQIGYHFTVDDFPTSVEDEVLNQTSVIIEVDDAPAQVMLDFNGETAPEIQFSMPAYANEAQRIANEQQRIANEQQRIQNEETRISNEEQRQRNEATRIAHEEARVSEFARLKRESQQATTDANDAATLANQKAQLAADKAALADDAAALAIQKAQLAAAKAALANDAAQLAAEKSALAQQKAEYAQQQGSYAKDQGDYAKNQGNYAKEKGIIAEEDHQRAEADHGIAVDDHTRAEADHGIAADDHTRAGNDHTRAEADHGIAADDHTRAGNDHTRAEADHGIAVDDHTQAGNDHTRAESDHTRAESDHAAVEVYVDSLGAFDISAYNAAGGVLAKYADLTAALGTNGVNIPEALRKGGMSIKFVQSSDNKYVQWRLMSNSFNTTPANWQGVDAEPTAGSKNLVESGGVSKELKSKINQKADDSSSNLNVADENGNVLVKFKDGHIKTKEFDSRFSPETKNDSSLSNLNITDENGNVLAQFKDGHIKTKEFNSKNISIENGFNGFVIDAVPAQNSSNSDREIDLNSATALEDLYLLWDSLISQSGGYIKKTIVGKDGSNTYDILKMELSVNNKTLNSSSPIPKTRKKIFIMPNQHGTPYDPIDASWTCYYLAKMLTLEYRNKPVWAKIRQKYDITMMACCNPWGMVNRSYGTYTVDPNGYHINCNRNWDYEFIPNSVESNGHTSSGPTPFCIPESQYLRDIILNDDIDLVIDLHSYGEGASGMKIFVADNTNPWLRKGAEVMKFVADMVDGVKYNAQISETALNGKSSPWITLIQKKQGVTLECACQSYGNVNTKFDSNPLTADLYALTGLIQYE